MKKYMSLLLGIALILSGCSSSVEDERRVLTVSIPPQSYLLKAVAGDKFEVRCMLAKGGNPETYEPSMAYMMNLEKSEAYFFVGNIGFESAIKGKIREFNPDIRIYDCSAGIELLRGGHHSDPVDKEDLDPHVWTSVPNARVIARNMLNAVAELDPDNRPYYEANFRRLDADLAAFNDSISRLLAPSRGSAFAVWHPSLSYFARDYGLEQVSIEYHGKEAPIRQMEDKVAYAKKRGVKVFLLQRNLDARQAETVCAQIGAGSVTINPLGYEWKQEMRRIADAVAGAH